MQYIYTVGLTKLWNKKMTFRQSHACLMLLYIKLGNQLAGEMGLYTVQLHRKNSCLLDYLKSLLGC